MSTKIKQKLKAGTNRTYLFKDFEAFRQNLIEQSRLFFPDKIKDFSEPSVAGMLIDVAASVADSLAFYLDHQYRELDPQLAVETENILTHLKNAGVKIFGASPSVATVTISVIVPSEKDTLSDKYLPKLSALPVILESTVVQASNGINFNLVEDVDFAEKDTNGNFVAKKPVHKTVEGVPTQFKMSLDVIAISGDEVVRTFQISDSHVSFREIILPDDNVSEILSVVDSDGNDYFEVDSLSQDTVFTLVDNTFSGDSDVVSKTLEVTPAPRRFITSMSPITRVTTLTFGSGNSEVLDDDIVPDPSELSLELFGKKSFSRFSIDPNSLLQTQTLGLSPRNTTLTITYRHGGGITHNVDANAITAISSLSLEFRNEPGASDALFVRQNVSVNNGKLSRGAQNPPNIEFLRSLIKPSRNSQSRIVTREDLIARIYTLPTEFGRVFRVGLSDHPENPLSLMLYVISLGSDGKLTESPDTLKDNLSTYLNEFRLISDAIDVVDADVVNYGIEYEVLLKKTANKLSVLQQINSSLSEALQLKYFQIDQPIVVSDIYNIIINSPGVVSLTVLNIIPRTNTVVDRVYSSYLWSVEKNITNGILRCPIGCIFELRFPEDDIIGYAI